MQYSVPTFSWVICIGVSIWFTFAWSFSGMDTSGPYMEASAYFWAAVPALTIGTCLLARPAKPARWISCAISAFPWAAFPWVALATFVPHGESRQWFPVAEALGFAFAVCVAVPVALRIAYLRRLSQPGEAPE